MKTKAEHVSKSAFCPIGGDGAKLHRYLLAALVAATASASWADVYYWKGVSDTSPSATGGAWSGLSNWSTESATGADAAALPGASDTFFGLQDRAIDLEGGEWTIGGWNSAHDHDWNRYNMALWNGTLTVVGDVTTHADTIFLRSGAKLVFAEGTTYTPAIWDAGAHRNIVNSGSELDIFGNLRIYKYELDVHEGGTAVLAPTKWDIYGNTAQKSCLRTDGGVLELPNGISFGSGSTDAGFGFSLELQNGGTLVLGGPVKKNGMPGTFNAVFDNGTIRATGSVSFDFDSVTVPDNASLILNVDEGASFDLSGVTYGEAVHIEKIGAGDFPYASNLPDTFVVSSGSLALSSANTAYDISGYTFWQGGTVKIGAAGVSLTAWDPSLLAAGGFVSGIAAPVVGSTLFTCADADVLALAKTGLNATLPDGFAVTESGNSLVVTSAYVFDSTTVTDLNDPAGWAGGAVPVGKVVTIKGQGVAPTTAALPEFAGITVMDGASLTVSNGGTIPVLTLSDSASLTIASGAVSVSGDFSIVPDGSDCPSITVASGATLNVNGGTTFTGCRLAVSGTLAATSDGALDFGYAAAGETSVFGLTVNGGTISTTAGNINFFCPAAGGTVTALGEVAFTGATFIHTNDYGFNFGVNNPASEAISFVFDNTRLNYPKRGYYNIAGGSALSFVNGASLWRDNNQNDKFTLTVSGLASICLGEGTSSLVGESSNSGGSVGNGAMTFAPDTEGFASLVVSNATWETYHSAGNGKAVAQIYGASLHTINQNNYNRTQPFDGFKAVNLNEGSTLTISNNVDSAGLDFSETFTGSGSLFFSTPRSTTRTFNFRSTTSTATGTIAAAADKNDLLNLALDASWPGTVVWNGKAAIAHDSTPFAMTLGGIDLASDFQLRIWGDGTSDHCTLTGAGFVDDGGKIAITIADGSEAEPGDSWTIARVPAGTFIPEPAGSAWTIGTREVDGDDAVVDVVLSPVATGDFTFEGDEVTDLSDPAGWSTESVPTGKDVKISGAGTVAIVSSAASFPAFASIAVRNGATLRIEADVTLPPLTIDSTSKVVIGDNSREITVAATLNPVFVTSCNATVSPVALPVLEVATNATLTVASGMKFKNVDFRLYGTIAKADISDDAPVFGYADSGETSYIAFVSDGGTFDIHSNQDRANGALSFVCPSSGGTVIPVGTITLRNSTRTVTGWDDFGDWSFGVNNPTSVPFDVLVDGTHIDCSSFFYAAGAANLSLVNGSLIRRAPNCLGHYFSQAIQDSATITVGEGCFIDFTTGDGSFGIDSQSAVDTVTVRDGGIYCVTYNSSGWARGVFAADGGVLGVGKMYSTRVRTDLLRGFGAARLDGDLEISSVNVGTGSTDWDRHVKMADIPFSGTGAVIVTNGVPEYPFTVTMVNGANTATGSIKVAKAEGDAETALFFADGANWAGTVVAGNVALTNLTDGATAAEVTFGTLELADDFEIRVWKVDDAFVSDKLNVGSFVRGRGKLKVKMMTDGVDFADRDEVVIGKIGKDAAMPSLPAGWVAKTNAIDGDDECVELVMQRGGGMQIILR